MDVRKMVAGRLRELETMEQAAANLAAEIRHMKCAGGDIGELEHKLRDVRLRMDTLRRAMQLLTPEERLVAQRLFILPAKGNVGRLCQELGVEQSTVYRRRDRVLKKLGKAMFGPMDN